MAATGACSLTVDGGATPAAASAPPTEVNSARARAPPLEFNELWSICFDSGLMDMLSIADALPAIYQQISQKFRVALNSGINAKRSTCARALFCNFASS
jgi:hypothetical protein